MGPYRPVQTRIMNAALELFAEHGVGGTSLQMIADRLGVTKAAVYHQFRAKDDIVLAVAQAELSHLEAILLAAEAQPGRAAAREQLVAGIIDLAISRGRLNSMLLGDPVIVRFFTRHEPYRQVMGRVHRILVPDEQGSQVPAAMLLAAISGAVISPLVVGIDEDSMRAELTRLARRFLTLPERI